MLRIIFRTIIIYNIGTKRSINAKHIYVISTAIYLLLKSKNKKKKNIIKETLFKINGI